MHRTIDIDPEFRPVTYGEIWVRVFDSIDGDTGTERTWRHFHVSPQSASEMTVEEALANVAILNGNDQHHAHHFEYYAVEVSLVRTVVTGD